jgi:CheY-like chemotaxis protein
MSAKILVVEDDRDIRKNMQRLLEVEGYTVQCAENGQVALDFLKGADVLPQLIILDLMMPIMDGFQFREVQLENPRLKTIPVAVMTADGHIVEKKARVRAEVAVRKPVDIETILKIAEQYCKAN